MALRLQSCGRMRDLLTPTGACVLLIEDHEGSARGLRELLLSRGYRVDVERDGGAGLLRATEGEYALVVADCDLGRCDGTDIVRRIRAERPGLPVLVVTARDRSGVLERLKGAGVAECFEKPVPADRLLAAVERRLNPGDPS